MDAPGRGAVALSPEGSCSGGGGEGGLKSCLWPAAPLQCSLSPTTPSPAGGLQDLNEIKTDSVEPCSGLSYKGFTQLSLSEFILSTPLSSSGCMLLISFKSLRRLVIRRGKCQAQLCMRTSRAQGRARARCGTPGRGEGGALLLQKVPELQQEGT